jgi:hypothetical protein
MATPKVVDPLDALPPSVAVRAWGVRTFRGTLSEFTISPDDRLDDNEVPVPVVIVAEATFREMLAKGAKP